MRSERPPKNRELARTDFQLAHPGESELTLATTQDVRPSTQTSMDAARTARPGPDNSMQTAI